MDLETFLNFPIQALQGVVFTPILSLAAILFFMLCLVLYNLSGLAEKVENLTLGKKAIVFFFITLLIGAFYYVFYKAGKFDELISNQLFNGVVGKIGDFINH